MAINIPRGNSDEIIDKIREVLHGYEADHPQARIDLYRQNPVSVRVRIVDPEFAGKSKAVRSQEAWTYLDHVPEDVQSDISLLLLLTPDETKASMVNVEFDDPLPSRL